MRRDRDIDLLPARVVGRRREPKPTPQGTDALLKTVRDLRGGLARRGLYRFESFEEAQEWMKTEASRRSGHRRSTTSGGSAAPSKTREPGTS